MSERGQTCSSCKWFNHLGGSCQKNPPTAHIIADQLGGMQILGIFPVTKPSNWCGSHEPDLKMES